MVTLCSTVKSFPYFPTINNINITTKTNWTTSDFRTSSNMMRIRNNIKAIVNAFHSLTSVGSVVNSWDYKKANNWEKVLWEIYSLTWGAEDWYVYGGVARGGQPRLWQHRFRQFFDPVRIVVAGELLTTENGDALATESGKHHQLHHKRKERQPTTGSGT